MTLSDQDLEIISAALAGKPHADDLRARVIAEINARKPAHHVTLSASPLVAGKPRLPQAGG